MRSPSRHYLGAILLFSGYAFGLQADPQNPGGAQGPFTSSGAPANTAGAQGAFFSSGAPANSAGPQAAAGPTAPEVALFDDQATRLADVSQAAARGNLTALRGYLRDPDTAVQSAAFVELSARDVGSAIRDLAAIIRDGNHPMRLQALQLLDSSPFVDDQSVRAALRTASADAEPLLRQFALEALHVRDALAALKPVHSGPAGPGAQGAFVSSGAPANSAGPQGAFVSSGAPANSAGPQPAAPARAGPSLVGAPLPEDAESRLTAVLDAAARADLSGLQRLLLDTDAGVQAEAFTALASRDQSSAVQALLSIIRDPGQPLRVQALRLLDISPEVDEVTVRSVLRTVLNDGDPLLQEYAVRALARRDAAGER